MSKAQHTLPSAPRAGVNSGQHPALSCSALVPASASAHAAERRVVGGRRHVSPLGHRQRSLLAMVHVPKAVKLRKVHVGLHAPVLIGLERVRGAGAEETPIRAGAAALRVGVGRLESHSGALAVERENTGIFILPPHLQFCTQKAAEQVLVLHRLSYPLQTGKKLQPSCSVRVLGMLRSAWN